MTLATGVRHILRHRMGARHDQPSVTHVQGLHRIGKPGKQQMPIAHRVRYPTEIALAYPSLVNAQGTRCAMIGEEREDRGTGEHGSELPQHLLRAERSSDPV